MSVKETLILQRALGEQIKAAISNIQNTPIEKWSMGYVTSKLEDLVKYWTAFDENHKAMLMIVTDKEKIDLEYFNKGQYTTCMGIVDEHRGLLRQQVYELTMAERVADASVVDNTAPKMENGQRNDNFNDVRLPKIQIPIFSGNYNQWRSFYDLFSFSVHNNTKLSNVQKLHYLKTSLSGEASQLLLHLQVTNANYEPAWQSLIKRYENKKVLVHTHLKTLVSQSIMSYESAFGVKRLLDTTTECLDALKALNVPIDQWDDILVFLTVQKLSAQTHLMWEESISDSNELPKFEQLKDFLESRFRMLEVVNTSNNKYSSTNKSTARAHHIQSHQGCLLCSQDHQLHKCLKYLAMPVTGRLEVISRNSGCFNCLSTKHTNARHACPSKGTNCDKCSKRHHWTLHGAWSNSDTPIVGRKTPNPFSKPSNYTKLDMSAASSSDGTKSLSMNPSGSTSGSTSSIGSTSNVSTNCVIEGIQQSKALLATALVRVETASGGYTTLRALLDQGSEANFITEAAAKLLGVKRIPVETLVSGIGAAESITSKGAVNLNFWQREGLGRRQHALALVLPSITSYVPVTNQPIGNWNHLRGLFLADPFFRKSSKIDILLGANVYADILQTGLRKGETGTPIAQNSVLGWFLSGRMADINPSGIHMNSITSNTVLVDEDTQLRRFWEIEEVLPQRKKTKEEEACEEFYAKTVLRDQDGRYVVQLPFRQDPDRQLAIGRSRYLAVASMQQLERRFSRNMDLHARYVKCIQEYLDLGHMVPVLSTELRRDNSSYRSCYLPHHAVLKESSTTTKLRVVFDASRKTASGTSLNDALMVGPTIQDDLMGILMRWRRHKIALSADIEKMYRQIRVASEDAEFQRIVWRKSINDPLLDYKLITVTFGTGIAPFLAIKSLRQLAVDESKRWPLASQAVLRDFYVDDILTGADSVDEAMELQMDLSSMLNTGGFLLRKWASNSNKVLEKIPKEHLEVKFPLDLELDEGIKSLGIQWSPATDTFSFAVNKTESKLEYTKRSFLSEVAKLFDPLGWTAPSIIIPKLVFQQLWKAKLKWDDMIPNAISIEWNQYRLNLQQLSKIKIKRWTSVQPNNRSREFHGFCDASKQAYAAVVYMRIEDYDGKVHVHLLAAKTKVAPIKEISIPRLELCGAVLLANLIKKVQMAMQIQENAIYAWTDSMIVLAWLKGDCSRWKTFVSNRVTEIIEVVGTKNWNHIGTSQNPADCATKGVSPELLKDHKLWWTGPAWLVQSKTTWPIDTSITETDLERKTERMAAMVTTKAQRSAKSQFYQKCLENASDFAKLVRILTYVRRYFLNHRLERSERNIGPVNREECKATRNVIIKAIQEVEFAKEFQRIKNDLPASKNIANLKPLIDGDGIIRVGGRLKWANMSFEEKHPFIIPTKTRLASLLVSEAHKVTLHGGVQLMLAVLRKDYWLLDARNTASKYIHQCTVCHRYKGKALQQLMGDLPAPRVNITRPFTHCGVDYAGPIDIRTTKGRGYKSHKGYIALFVCLCTKAIHLEAVSDLTTDSFLAAFKRFVGRRGYVSEMYSDNGTNFAGADTKLKKALAQHTKFWYKEQVKAAKETGIKWNFIPAAAPHFGGLWEAGVKSMKHHMKRVVGNSTLTFEELSTVLIQIEAVLNSRPLCPITSDSEDLNALTPGHFLMGTTPITPPEPCLLDLKTHSLSRWQTVERMYQDFWDQWSQEYLSRLQQRPKWTRQTTNIQIGALVLLKDERIPPSKWPLARVKEIHAGKDGLVRVVKLKLKNTELLRPITKICPLPITH